MTIDDTPDATQPHGARAREPDAPVRPCVHVAAGVRNLPRVNGAPKVDVGRHGEGGPGQGRRGARRPARPAWDCTVEPTFPMPRLLRSATRRSARQPSRRCSHRRASATRSSTPPHPPSRHAPRARHWPPATHFACALRAPHTRRHVPQVHDDMRRGACGESGADPQHGHVRRAAPLRLGRPGHLRRADALLLGRRPRRRPCL